MCSVGPIDGLRVTNATGTISPPKSGPYGRDRRKHKMRRTAPPALLTGRRDCELDGQAHRQLLAGRGLLSGGRPLPREGDFRIHDLDMLSGYCTTRPRARAGWASTPRRCRSPAAVRRLHAGNGCAHVEIARAARPRRAPTGPTCSCARLYGRTPSLSAAWSSCASRCGLSSVRCRTTATRS